MSDINLKWAKAFLRLINDQDWWSNRESYLRVLVDLEENFDWYINQKQKISLKHLNKQTGLLVNSIFAEPGVSISPLSVVDGKAFIGKDTFIGPGCYFSGNIYICSNVHISAGVVIEGPTYIGSGTIVGPNCFINAGAYIGSDCHIGQGAEIKSSILLNGVRMFHFSYVGHSIIGHRANIAAGVIISVRRFDGQHVSFSFDDTTISVGQKGGALIGDDVQLGVGTLIPPGRQICPRVAIFPGSIVKRDILFENRFMSKGFERYTGSEPIVFVTTCFDSKRDNKETDSLNQALWVQVSNLWDKEADRFWTRNNILLLVNGGLIALLSTIKVFEVVLSISILGILLSILWLWINTISKYYLNRWKPILEKIEENWEVKPITQIDEDSEINFIPLKYEPSSTYMKWIICSIGFFWIIVFIACLLVYILNIDLAFVEIKRLA